MIYLDPRNDLTFKRVFGEHPHLLISFLNAVLPIEPGQEVREIEYLSPELVPQLPTERNSIVDVRCKSQDGRIFIVEMQMLWSHSFQQRVLFNASKAYLRQIEPGQHYDLLQPVISLNLLNETYLKGEEWYHHYRITEVEGTGHVIAGLEFVFIELPKFRPQSEQERRLRRLWLRFLTEVGKTEAREIPAELAESSEVKAALQLVERSSYSKAELEAYERYWDGVSVVRTIEEDARKEGREEGIGIGREEGIGIGREEGIGIGREEGIGIGREEGEWIGKIHLLEHLMGGKATPKTELEGRGADWLEARFDALQKEFQQGQK